jgi:hypothetical protein
MRVQRFQDGSSSNPPYELCIRLTASEQYRGMKLSVLQN